MASLFNHPLLNHPVLNHLNSSKDLETIANFPPPQELYNAPLEEQREYRNGIILRGSIKCLMIIQSNFSHRDHSRL